MLRRSPRLTRSASTSSSASGSVSTATSAGTGRGRRSPFPSDTPSRRPSPLLDAETRLWSSGHKHVVGVDEAGRGPLAGPVVVAAVCFDCNADDADQDDADQDDALADLDDSKKMTEEGRDRAYAALTSRAQCHWAVKVVDHTVVDEMNILRASLWGMDQVVADLLGRGKCDYVLVDGPYLPPQVETDFVGRADAVIGGDAKVRAIAAASVIAKVTRDRLMREMHEKWPAYRFDLHKAYPTALHRQLLMQHGPCPIHRMSYRPVMEAKLAMERRSSSLNDIDDQAADVIKPAAHEKRPRRKYL